MFVSNKFRVVLSICFPINWSLFIWEIPYRVPRGQAVGRLELGGVNPPKADSLGQRDSETQINQGVEGVAVDDLGNEGVIGIKI